MTIGGAGVTVEVLRYRPEQDANPRMQSYQVPYTEDMSVLQALQYVKDHLDGSLCFRWSCRMAICGSCGMMIDGAPQLACQTILRDYNVGPLRIEPLEHFPIERDLVVRCRRLYQQTRRASILTSFRKTPRTLAEGEYLQTPAQLARF